MLDHAYYNNGETQLSLSGGGLVSLNEYKKSSTALTFDGLFYHAQFLLNRDLITEVQVS